MLGGVKEKIKTPEGKILNPKSGRYVDINGKIGKEIVKSAKKQKSPKEKPVVVPQKKEKIKTPEGKILNPKSGRYVDINGKIGKEIAKAAKKQASPEKELKAAKKKQVLKK